MDVPYQLILGWALAVASTVIVLPQLVHVIRVNSDEGVELRTVSLAAASLAAWVGFTVQIGDVPAFASSLGPLVVWCITGIIVAARRRLLVLFSTTLITAVLAVAALGLFYDAFHVIAVAGSLCWIVPQVVTACRVSGLAGVSVPAYALLFIENAGWVGYAIATSTPAYAIAPVVQGPLALLIAILAFRSHQTTASSNSHPQPPSNQPPTPLEFSIPH